MTFKFVKLDMIFTTSRLCKMPTMCISFREGIFCGLLVILLSFRLDLPPLSPLLFPLLYYLSPFPFKNYMAGSHTYTGYLGQWCTG